MSVYRSRALGLFLFVTTSLTSPCRAQKPLYAGLYAQSVTTHNGQDISNGQKKQGIAAFNNPFVTGILLTTKWTDIEPLPPGINFCAGTETCSKTLTLGLVGGGTVMIPCLHAQQNYCWDTVDQQLELINKDAHGTLLAIGFDVHAGYHSPAWLSNGLTTINTDTSISGSTGVDAAGVGIFFNGADVSNAQPSGSYSNLGTVSCSSFESLTLGTSSTACSNSQNLTSWLGVTGGNDGGGSCHAVKLPIPYVRTPGLPAVAPVASLYADMLVALHAHSNSYTGALGVSGFDSRLGVIKLGSFMSGEDAEFSLLGGNSSGSNTARLPTEAGVTPPAAVSNCPTSSVAAYWQTHDTDYNPRTGFRDRSAEVFGPAQIGGYTWPFVRRHYFSSERRFLLSVA